MLTELPYALQGKIYRCPMPFSYVYDPAGNLLEAMKNAGVGTVVMLTSDLEATQVTGRDLRKIYESESLQVIYFPIRDFGTPEMAELHNVVDQVLKKAKKGENIAIHCHAGIGRTGLFAACMARSVFGYSAEGARIWLRQWVDGAVETIGQFEILKAY